MVGVGKANVFDTYLSPLEYEGTDFRLLHESMRMTRIMGGRVSVQNLVQADFAYAEVLDDLRHAVDEEVRREQHTQRHDARERMSEEYYAGRDGYDRHEGLLPRAVARAHRAEGPEGAAEADSEQEAADHRLDRERREQRHRKRDEAEREHNRADDVESSLTFHEIFF